MKNAEVFDHDETAIILDKAYHVRFTMRAVFMLEKKYESITAALDVLCGDDATQATGAVVDFLCTLTEASPETVAACLDAARFPKAYSGLFQTIRRDIPLKEGDRPEGEDIHVSRDWDKLYFVGRERLKSFFTNDEEFWNSTPRRFWKLYELWLWDNDHETEPQTIEDMEVYMGELDT